MGYELNRLMKQYGVATPTIAAAPQMPGAAPVESAYTGKEGSPGDAAKYAADKAAFDESVRKYGLAQKEYDQYKTDYQNRLANTNMYNQAQYSTTGATTPPIVTFSPMQKYVLGYGTAPTAASTPADYLKSDAYKDFQKENEGAMHTMDMYQSPYFGEFGSGSMGRAQDAAYEAWLKANPTQVVPASQSGFGIGQEAVNKNIRDWMAAHPDVSAKELIDIKQKYDINDWDMRNAMGTGKQYGTPQWTDTIKAPTYDVAPISLAAGNEQDKVNWYAGRRGIGYTDADLRAGAEKTFGKLPDTDWNYLRTQAGYPLPNFADTPGSNVGTGDTITITPNTPTVNTLVAADGSPKFAPGDPNSPDYQNSLPPDNTEYVDPYTGAITYPNQPAVDPYASGWAHGGAVKGYQTGGMKDPLTGVTTYAVPMMPDLQTQELEPLYPPAVPAVSDVYPDEAQRGSRAGAVYVPAGDATATRSIAAAAPATARAAPTDDRMLALQAMLAQYGPQNIDYSSQITTARASQKAEQKAFEDMLRKQLASPEDAASSRAEMYFRLASAFGSPTKTGHFTENLSLAGKEMAESAKTQRADRAKKLGIQLELQKMKMEGANKEVDTLRALQAETMKDRRAIAQEMIKEYIASGKAQSTAGKMAQDMGLTPGTPEYQKKVEELSILEVQKQTALINAQLASIAAQQKRGEQMSPAELALRVETESNLDNVKTALDAIKDAYARNPNSYDGSLIDATQKKIYETFGSDDPKVINTQIIDNLLGQQGLASLKTTFGGNPTEGERKILLELQGIGAKSRAQRGEIMMRLYAVLKEREKRNQTRLNDIISGRYRTYDTSVGGQQ